jgi:AcrR family transcriptional regulator
VARWDPGTEERLIKAALGLFTDRGYDNVTVAQIAERAGITRRSYFRYFPDKREVLFAGSDRLPLEVHRAVLADDKTASPLAAVLNALAHVGTHLVEHVAHSAERRAVIEASAELAERERTKLAAVATAIYEALVERQVETRTATLVAQLATITFKNAFDDWIDAHESRDFASCLHAVAEQVRDTLD